ncbi:MAG TPA: hypothetical protein VFY60_00265 [Pyrinomonadaceae bacterium]|nr:hypothetical protein [Pyrinomonadaceae bacterium]
MPRARVFQCPACREFIATDATRCRFCSYPIDAQTAQSAADAQDIENKRYMRKRYARHMLTGGGLCLLGLFITAVTVTVAPFPEVVEHMDFTFGMVIVGAGDFIYGLAGWLSELK